MFPTAFLFLRPYWIVSAGPSGHLKQSVQKTLFQQCSTSTRWRALKPEKLFRSCPNIVATSSLCFGMVVLFRRRLKSDQYRTTYRKTIKYETTLDHARRRRRAGPPAFRRNYRQTPKATLYLLLGGRLFLGNFGTFRSGEGPAPSP